MRDFLGGWLACLAHYRNDLIALSAVGGIFFCIGYAAINPPV